MDVATGEVTRAEALLRWKDPERGLVLPAGFIPLAEESGLGHAVGQWVLEAACRQARALARRGRRRHRRLREPLGEPAARRRRWSRA